MASRMEGARVLHAAAVSRGGSEDVPGVGQPSSTRATVFWPCPAVPGVWELGRGTGRPRQVAAGPPGLLRQPPGRLHALHGVAGEMAPDDGVAHELLGLARDGAARAHVDVEVELGDL